MKDTKPSRAGNIYPAFNVEGRYGTKNKTFSTLPQFWALFLVFAVFKWHISPPK